jgi:hypothetical protein
MIIHPDMSRPISYIEILGYHMSVLLSNTYPTAISYIIPRLLSLDNLMLADGEYIIPWLSNHFIIQWLYLILER